MLAPGFANRAAALGLSRFDWWRDWRGRAVAIIACGASAKSAEISLLRGKMPVLAIKEAAVDLCPWADVVYGCDAPWWRYRSGLPAFKGLKLRWAENGCDEYPDVHPVTIQHKELDRIIVEEPGVIGSGRNSGFQALNIAVQFGATRILKIGFDIQGEHFYGRNNWMKANNPDAYNFQRWTAAFGLAAEDLKQLGIEAVNASPISALTCFRAMTVAQALECWSLS